MCAICHGNIKPNEVALVRGCDHAFCSLCILNWATQKRKCPLCLERFTHLWLYRRIDGSYNDYLFEESVDLLTCAVWFKKGVTAEFSPCANVDDEEDDYHEMLQWMYGGGREAAEEDDYYDDVQEGLERGRPGTKAFGQRKFGSGGYVAVGGSRLAARVPNAPSAPIGKAAVGASPAKMNTKGKQPYGSSKLSPKGTFETAAGFESAVGFGAGAGSSSAAGSSSSAGKRAADKKAEKAALKEAQKEKRRSWAVSG